MTGLDRETILTLISVVLGFIIILALCAIIYGTYTEIQVENELLEIYPELKNYTLYCIDQGYDEYFDSNKYDTLYGDCYSDKYGFADIVDNMNLDEWRKERLANE